MAGLFFVLGHSSGVHDDENSLNSSEGCKGSSASSDSKTKVDISTPFHTWTQLWIKCGFCILPVPVPANNVVFLMHCESFLRCFYFSASGETWNYRKFSVNFYSAAGIISRAPANGTLSPSLAWLVRSKFLIFLVIMRVSAYRNLCQIIQISFQYALPIYTIC